MVFPQWAICGSRSGACLLGSLAEIGDVFGGRDFEGGVWGRERGVSISFRYYSIVLTCANWL